MSGFPGPQICEFLDFQIPRFPDAAGRTLRSQPDPSPNVARDQIMSTTIVPTFFKDYLYNDLSRLRSSDTYGRHRFLTLGKTGYKMSNKWLKNSLGKSHLYMDNILCIKWGSPLGWHIGSPDGSRFKQEAKGSAVLWDTEPFRTLSYWAEMMRMLATDLK